MTASRSSELLCNWFPPTNRGVTAQADAEARGGGWESRAGTGLCYLGPAQLPTPASAFNIYMAVCYQVVLFVLVLIALD